MPSVLLSVATLGLLIPFRGPRAAPPAVSGSLLSVADEWAVSAGGVREHGGALASTQLVQPEVLPPAPPGLSDSSVARILELVWRDTRKVVSEYRLGDVSRGVAFYVKGNRAPAGDGEPEVVELIRERLPLLRWWVEFRALQDLQRTEMFMERLNLSPRSVPSLRRQQNKLQRRIDEKRSTLWPTLRKLLLTTSMHRRLVRAARSQMNRNYIATSVPESARAWLGSPMRLLRLWLAMLKSAHYALRWVLNEFGLRWLLTAKQRQVVRTQLIERAIIKGLELQRQVERIEEEAKKANTGPGGGPRNDVLLTTLLALPVGALAEDVDEVTRQEAALQAAKAGSKGIGLSGGRARAEARGEQII